MDPITIPENSEKVGFFQVHSQHQKNLEQIKEFKDWAPWNSMYGIPCTSQLFFIPLMRGFFFYFERSPIPLPPQ